MVHFSKKSSILKRPVPEVMLPCVLKSIQAWRRGPSWRIFLKNASTEVLTVFLRPITGTGGEGDLVFHATFTSAITCIDGTFEIQGACEVCKFVPVVTLV